MLCLFWDTNVVHRRVQSGRWQARLKLILRACPAHVLSDAVSLKIFELFFIFRARQFDRPANFIANFCDIVASDCPAKNKNDSGLVFIRNLNRFCCSCVIVTPHLRGSLRDQNVVRVQAQVVRMYKRCNYGYSNARVLLL